MTTTTKRRPRAPVDLAGLPDDPFAGSDAPLFSSEPPPPRPTPPRRLTACAVCGEPGAAAHPAHKVCQVCASDPVAARARVETQRRIVVSDQHRAARAAQAAYDALSDEERAKWTRFCEIRARRDVGDATDAERALLQRTRDALANPDDPRYSAALRRVFHADEGLFWANAACDDGQRRCDTKLAQLALCLEDMEARP